MSELEPTRTELKPTATEVLRRMLGERGVEWEDDSPIPSMKPWKTSFTSFTGEEVTLSCYEEPKWIVGTLVFHTPEQAIEATLGTRITGDTSDGYHTFNELYHHRAVLFSVIVRDHQELAWKSRLHHDGTMYDGMFIVGIETPRGQATYHYDVDPYWDMFDCRELERAPEWDGHTPSEAIVRISTLGRGTCHVMTIGEFNGEGTEYYDYCSNCGYEYDDEPLNYCPNCGRKVVGE